MVKSYDDVEEDYAEAAMILNSRVFNTVLSTLRDIYIRQLLECEVNSLTATTAHASMKVVEDVKSELQFLVNDYKIRRSKNK